MPQRYDPIHDVLIETDETPAEPGAAAEDSKEEPSGEAKQKSEDVEHPQNENLEEEKPIETNQEENEETDPESRGELKEESKEAPKPEEDQEMKDAANEEHKDGVNDDSKPQKLQQSEISSETATASSTEQPLPETGKKHKLSPSPTKFQLKKPKKQGGTSKSATVLSSARSRHLKKDDGKPFLRKDIQYQFLKKLFGNKTRAFTDPYPESKDKVMTEPEDEPNHKLTFAELYIKTIAHSSKCSKILRDRLLNDMQMSIPTSMICLLVNVGRMNTTINFVPDMKSQLRTYHSIPCLQVDYDASDNKYAYNGNGGDKQLQDTPRLKSILKACCDDTDEPNALTLLEKVEKIPKTSVINAIFLLCNAEESVTKKFLEGTGYSFFDIFMNSEYDPDSRAHLFMWLIYTYLETHLDEAGINENPFGPGGKPEPLTKSEGADDIDTPQEIEFGERLYNQRVKFLAEDDGTDAQNKREEKAEKKKHSSETPVKLSKTEKLNQANKSSNASGSKTPSKSKAENLNNNKNNNNNERDQAPSFQFPLLPKNDIDTRKVRKSIKYLARMSGKKRTKMGQLKYEHQKIENQDKSEGEGKTGSGGNDEGTPAALLPHSSASRLRLKDYKGDYAENSDKFYKLMNLLKNDFVEMTKADQKSNVEVGIHYANPTEDLTLKSFTLDI